MRGTKLLPWYFSHREKEGNPFHVAGEEPGSEWTDVEDPTVCHLLQLAVGLVRARAWCHAHAGPVTRAVLSRRFISIQGVLYAVMGLMILLPTVVV